MGTSATPIAAPQAPPFDPSKLWSQLVSQGMSRQQATQAVNQHLDRATAAMQPTRPDMPAGLSALMGLAQGTAGHLTGLIGAPDALNKMAPGDQLSQQAQDSAFGADAQAANPTAFAAGKLAPDAILAAEGLKVLGGIPRIIAKTMVSKLGGPILRQLVQEVLPALKQLKPEFGADTGELINSVVKADQFGLEPETVARLKRQGLLDQTIEALAKTSKSNNPTAAKAATDVLTNPSPRGVGTPNLTIFRAIASNDGVLKGMPPEAIQKLIDQLPQVPEALRYRTANLLVKWLDIAKR